MNTPKTIFTYSEQDITIRKKKLVALMLGLPIGILPLFLVLRVCWSGKTIIVTGLFLCLIELLLWLIVHISNTLLRQRQLHVDETRLAITKQGATIQEIPWNSITKIRTRFSPSARVVVIEIFSISQRPLLIDGFEEMSTIVQRIEHALAHDIPKETRMTKYDWGHPLLLYSSFMTIGIGLGGLYRAEGDDMFKAVTILFQFIMGIAFLVYGPISRVHPKFRRWEILSSVVYIMLVLFNFVGEKFLNMFGLTP